MVEYSAHLDAVFHALADPTRRAMLGHLAGRELTIGDLAEHCVIAAIIRDGVMALPRGDSTLQAEDEIIAVASAEGAQKLSDLLAYPVYPMRNGKKKE